MKFMVQVRANEDTEAGYFPPNASEMFAAMDRFNQGLIRDGWMLGGDGLQPSSKAKRIRMAGSKRTVVDGPFAETKELVAGYWIWQVRSLDEAVEWARRCPAPMPGEEGVLEIRPFFEAEDFGKEYTPELRERDERLRQEIERQQKSQA